MTTRFSHLTPGYLGFDNLFDELDRLLSNNSPGNAFPPTNIWETEDGYVIEMAVAGYARDDITIRLTQKKQKLLTVTGIDSRSTTKPTESARSIRQGIAARTFERSFTIADNVEVSDAKLENGMLTINLKKLVPQEEQPKLIAIN